APRRARRRVPPAVAGWRSRVSRSLRRTLAVRFAATMGVGLLAVAAAVLYGSHLFFQHHLDPTAIRAALVPVLLGVVVLVTTATFVGAWWLAGSAVQPVCEITEQATRIEAGTLDQRTVAHADTAEYRGLCAVLNRHPQGHLSALKT